MSSEASTPRALLRTLLVSDLVGSTRLTEELGDEAAARLFRRHDAVARGLLAEHEGREIDKTDGFLLLFRRPISAVLYALDYHQALAELSRESGVEFAARVGIHLGEVVVRENPPEDVARGAKPLEVEGLAKPMAARLMSVAVGGQTLLTRGAEEMARRAAVDRLSADRRVRWIGHGFYRFKGVESPVEVFEVGVEGFAPLRPPPESEKVKAEPGFTTGPIHVRQRRRWLVPAVAAAAVAVAALAWWGLARGRPAPGAGSVKVTPFTVDGGWKDMAQLSPEGERVAYLWDGPASDNFDIWVKPLGVGASALRLTEHPETDSSPVWSPNGRQLAFVRRLEDEHAVFIVPALGGQERQLAKISTAGYDSGVYGPGLAWSPDGSWLAVSEKPSDTGPARIVRLSIDSSRREAITAPPGSSYGDLYPSFSPDGELLAFVRLKAEFWGNADVWIQQVDGGEPRQLTFGGYDSFLGLTWSPRGDELLFATGPTGRVSRVPVGGGEPALVAGTGAGSAFPMVRDQAMVYTQMRSWNMDIWRVGGPASADADAPPRKLIFSTQVDASPSYSPQGDRIAFQSTRSGTGNIWVCNADGSSPTQLTFFDSHTGTPRWSPDGSRLVFDSLESGSWDVYVVEAAQGMPTRLTDEPSDEGTGSWSRDGRWVYFHSDRSGSVELWKTPADGGGEAVQLTRNGGFYGLESWDGRYLYFVKSHSESSIWRIPVDGGEEVELLAEPLALWLDWDLAREAIYFSRAVGHGPARVFTIYRLDLESGGISEILRREGMLDQLWLGVAPDESSILYGETLSWQSELMLVENFS